MPSAVLWKREASDWAQPLGLFGQKTAGPPRQPSAGKRISWGEETLAGYLENPRSSIPGTKVIFADIQEGERGGLTAYFKKATNE